VGLSVIIWATPLTAIQLVGYSIALGGLIWYKVGNEQVKQTFNKFMEDENSVFNKFWGSFWAKLGWGLLALFIVLASLHGFVKNGGSYPLQGATDV